MVKKSKVSKNFSDPKKRDTVFAETEKLDNQTPVQSEEKKTDRKDENVSSGPRYGFSTEIPDKYDESYVCAIPLNPKEMYVYWEFSPDDSAEISLNSEIRSNTEISSDSIESVSKLILRLKEKNNSSECITDSVKESFLVEIDDSVCSKVIETPQSGKEYMVESGYISTDGAFKPVASSEPQEFSPSPVKDTRDSHPILSKEEYEMKIGAETKFFHEKSSKSIIIDNKGIINLPDCGSSPQKW